MIINLFGTTLGKGPQKLHDKFLRSNPTINWTELQTPFYQWYRKDQTDKQIYDAIILLKIQPTKKVEEFYEQSMDLIDNLSKPPRVGFIMMNF